MRRHRAPPRSAGLALAADLGRGGDYAEWVPGDWRSGQIQAEITALNLPPGQEATAVVSSDPDPERAFFRALYGGKRVRR